MQEKWKQFRDTRYYVSNLGDVMNWVTLQKVCGSKTSQGYLKQAVWHDGKVYHIMQHRMVAECFIPNPENKPTVNHKDGVKDNNAITNLEWSTISENVQHAFDYGFAKNGEDSACAILSEAQVYEAASLFKTHSVVAIAFMLGVSTAAISNIKNGNTWKHLNLAAATKDRAKYHHGKLRPEDIPIIRQMFIEGKGNGEIGRIFGVHGGSISGIRLGKNWKNY